MAAGIDDIAIYIPRLFMDAGDFAEARGLDPQKLVKGLGVSKMAIVDANQDPACLAANACLKIMQKNKLNIDEFVQCNIDERYAQKINSSNSDAQKLGITGTPAFYVISSNSNQVQTISGAQPYEVFEKIFNSMLEN